MIEVFEHARLDCTPDKYEWVNMGPVAVDLKKISAAVTFGDPRGYSDFNKTFLYVGGTSLLVDAPFDYVLKQWRSAVS